MNQEQLKEQFLQYAENNLNNDTILQAVIQLLENIADELCMNGYSRESNRLITSQLIIKDLLKESETIK